MTVEEKMFLEVTTIERLDVISGKPDVSRQLTLSIDQLQQGLVAEVGCRNFGVLSVLAAHISKGNMAFPTIDKIMELTGLSRATVIKSVEELTQVEIGGQAVISKSKVVTPAGHTKSIYHFVSMPADPTNSLTAQDFIAIFSKHFEETFNIPYSANYKREVPMVRDKLMTTYSNADLTEIIRIAVTKYEAFSNNLQSYPTPTIGMLASWLANKAAGELIKEQKAQKEFEEKAAFADKVVRADSVAMLDL